MLLCPNCRTPGARSTQLAPAGEAPNLSHPLCRALGVVLASWLLIATAAAQESPPAEPAPPPAAPAAAPPAFSAMRLPGLAAAPATTAPAVTSDSDVQSLIGTLEDDTRRAELIARLKALGAVGPPPSDAGLLTQALDSINEEIEERVDRLGEALVGLASSVQQLPVLASWIRLQLTEPVSRQFWWSIGQQVGVAGIAGFLASLLVRLLLRRWRDARTSLPLAARSKARIKGSLAYLSVDLAALITFLSVTYGALAYTSVSILARQVAGDILIAIAAVRGITALSRAYLAPENPRRRLAKLDDAAAAAVQWWLALLLGLSIYGYFGLEAARRLGLPWTVHAFLTHILFFVVAMLAIKVIYGLRANLGAAIERWGTDSSSGLARYLPWRAFSVIGHHMAAAWVALVYLVWALGVPGGAVILTRGVLATVIALVGLRALNLWLDRVGSRPPEANGEAVTESAEAEPPPRSAAYVAVVTTARAVGLALAVLLILQAWGLDVAGWLAGDDGRSALVTASRIAVIGVVVLAAAKLIQTVAARYVGATDANGNLLYTNRTRTLVSMTRNLCLTLVVVIGAIEALSAFGVNANALLAGAGVLGLAIGFGAQTLVKDLITGLFILVGDTVRVGDVVDLGGKAGVVEAISMRTITLRAYSGDVHTIPYSSIDVVTNMTKDFSYYVFDLRIAYQENTDRVVEVLREIDSQLRREWPYRRLMLEPLEVAGVDAFMDSGVLIKARTKVRAGEQWKVGREFNRRIKRRFDELGIEIPVPQQKVSFAGSATEEPPPDIEQQRRDLLAGVAPARRAVGES